MPEPDMSILNLIESYTSSGALPMHMPGHKRNTALSQDLEKLGAKFDLTEIEGFDNLQDPKGMLLKSMKRASKLWGSRKCLYLVNGSSGGLLAAVGALAGRGDKVITARNCHMSVYNALELSGAEPVFLMPQLEKSFGIYASMQPDKVKKALAKNPDAKAVILTSPTYEGVISDVAAICEAAHKRGVPVIVDEAHGAHLGFSPFFAGGAVKAGADIVIQSLHKTLPSLTQTAIAHINGSLIDETELRRRLALFQSSSPSYLLLSSIDCCVRLLETDGAALFENWEENLKLFYDEVKPLEKLKIFAQNVNDLHKSNVSAFDPSKIFVSAREIALSGAELMELLRRKYKIELEMAWGYCALAMTGPGDTEEGMLRFARALLEIDSAFERVKTPKSGVVLNILPKRNCAIDEALRSEKILVETKCALGKTAAEYIWAYPPGVPLLIPGEEIGAEFLSALEENTRHGVALKSTSGNLPGGILVKD